MALDPVAQPDFATVPAYSGVPALTRAIGEVTATSDLTVSLETSDGLSYGIDAGEPVWGIYDSNGALAATADSVFSLEYRNASRVPDYPIEQGGFANYNKVATPFESHVVLLRAGTDADRTDLLTTIASMLSSLDFFTVVTPEVTYDNVNVVSYDYARSSQQGVELLRVNVGLQEIRIIDAGKFTKGEVQSDGTVGAEPMGGLSNDGTSTVNVGELNTSPAQPVTRLSNDGTTSVNVGDLSASSSVSNTYTNPAFARNNVEHQWQDGTTVRLY